MNNTLTFCTAYDSYYKAIDKYVLNNMEVLEVGGGAHPSIQNRANLSYTIVDPDQSELEKHRWM